MTKYAVLLLCSLLLLAPLVSAHGAPSVRSIDTRIHEDGTTAGDYGALDDAGLPMTPFYNGAHDLLALDVREGTHLGGIEGLYLRLIAQRGSGDLTDVITFSAGGQDHEITLSTSDNVVFEQEGATAIWEAVPVGDGFPFAVDLFVSYAQLGVTAGDALENIQVISYNGGDEGDHLAGGYVYEGILIEDPSSEAPSLSYSLSGVQGLFAIELDASTYESGDVVTATVTSSTDLEQQVNVYLQSVDGISEPQPLTLVATGDALTASFEAPESGDFIVYGVSSLLDYQAVLAQVEVEEISERFESLVVGPGQTIEYLVPGIGTFSYHNHASPGDQGTLTVVAADGEPKTHAITYTEDGFSPSEMEVHVGDTIVWTNDSEGDLEIKGGYGSEGIHDHGDHGGDHSHGDDHDHGDHDHGDDKESPGVGILALVLIALVGAALRRR